jgi:transposase, IS30 family
VIRRLQRCWSPEQIAGRLRRERRLRISPETIYRYIWTENRRGGTLCTYFRGARKQRRERYGAYASRGRLTGKGPLTARPHAAEARTRVGHREADPLLGAGQAAPCLLTMVERKTGYVALGKLRIRRAPEVNQRVQRLIHAQPRPVRTMIPRRGYHLARPGVSGGSRSRRCPKVLHEAVSRVVNVPGRSQV